MSTQASQSSQQDPQRKYKALVAVLATAIGLLFAGVSAGVDIGLLRRDKQAPTNPTAVSTPPTGGPVPSDGSPPVSSIASDGSDGTAPTPAGPTQSASSGYVVIHALDELRVPKPGLACKSTRVDLDRFSSKSSSDSVPDGTDLLYSDCENGGGLANYHAENLGTGPLRQPSAENCEQEAGKSAVEVIEAADARPGKTAFCVVTNEGRIAWMYLTSKGPLDNYENADLKFRAIVWELKP
ncbi:hypothetical protein AB0883_14710 [Micromonospora sp. NPDC047812]|uniref:hypothetical protein n=1 Tax=Micromonospora sp. NPDC047812 TaxID=3155742 RepID=UPI003451C766